MQLFIGIILPLVGTILGSLMILIFKNIEGKLYRLLSGIACGVMLSAVFFSFITPAIDIVSDNPLGCIGITLAFLFGFFLLQIFDLIFGENKNIGQIAFIVHNIPEGFSSGVALVGIASGNSVFASTSILISIGIAIQNIPDGAIASLNSLLDGNTKRKSIIFGITTGLVEPLAAILAMILVNFITPIIPFVYSVSAGVIIYVIVDELIPNSKGVFGNLGFGFGFSIIMILNLIL